jgi:uncharacterized protein YecT (DUF1311 family)
MQGEALVRALKVGQSRRGYKPPSAVAAAPEDLYLVAHIQTLQKAVSRYSAEGRLCSASGTSSRSCCQDAEVSLRILPAVALLLALAACNENGGQAPPSPSVSVTTATVVTPSPTVTQSSTPAPVVYHRACEQTAMTQRELNECAAGELAEVEALLPALLRQARKTFTPALVDEGQRRWLAFREAECAMQASPYEGGSIVPMTISFCKTTFTVERITNLRQAIKVEEELG